MRKLILALSISLVFSLALGGVVVFAANATQPGNPLYTVEQSLDAAISFLQDAVNVGDLEQQSVAAQDDSPLTPNDLGDGAADDDLLDDGDDPEDPEDPKDSAYCPCDAANPHPAGEKLANKYLGEDNFEDKYTEIMTLFCERGFGFGEIDLGYRIAAANPGVDVSVIFGLREEGMGWGQIMKEYPMLKPPKDPKPGLGNGNGNAGGNGIAGGNGNANGHTKVKEKSNNGNANGHTKDKNKDNKGKKP